MKHLLVALLTVCMIFSFMPSCAVAEEFASDELALSEELDREELLLLEPEEEVLQESEINVEAGPEEIVEQPEFEEILLTEIEEEQTPVLGKKYYLPPVTAASPGELDHDALLNGYVYRLFWNGFGEQETYEASTVSERLTGLEAKTYQILKRCVSEVASGERSSTAFCIPVTDLTGGKTTWTEAELGIPASADDAQVEKAVGKVVFCNLDVVLNALLPIVPMSCTGLQRMRV